MKKIQKLLFILSLFTSFQGIAHGKHKGLFRMNKKGKIYIKRPVKVLDMKTFTIEAKPSSQLSEIYSTRHVAKFKKLYKMRKNFRKKIRKSVSQM